MNRIIICLAFGLAFNSAIGGVTSLFDHKLSLLDNILFAQCVGLTIITISLIVRWLVEHRVRRLAALALSLPVSVALGTTLGFLVIGKGSWQGTEIRDYMLVGLFFGCIGSVFFFLSERIESEVRQRLLVESESEKRAIEAHLKLLQAQIEPHFLFNTLANVSSLIDGNPELAKQLLNRLDDWLRVALVRARSSSTTFGDEIDMLGNYLEIMKIRFGDRLRWRIEASEDVRRSDFPPMLLQPLVENAVRHGIEPKVGGGMISVVAQIDADVLRISVRDNGLGIDGSVGAAGVGLNNVRARLETLFGSAGELTLQGNDEGGATATLILPCAAKVNRIDPMDTSNVFPNLSILSYSRDHCGTTIPAGGIASTRH